MPSAAMKRKHGGVKRIRTKRLNGGRYMRIYFFKDGKTWVEVKRRATK